MSLTNVSTAEVIKKQFVFKLSTYKDFWRSLLIVQLIGLVFSSVANTGGSMMSDYYSVNISTYSINVVFFFTLFWAAITAFLIASRSYRYEDFSFITNRLTSSISSALFIVTVTFTAAVFTVLSSYVIFMVMKIVADSDTLPGTTVIGGFGEQTVTFIGIFGYLLLIASAGYLLGNLVQIHRAFIILIPILFVLPGMMTVRFPVINYIFEFYFQESSVLLFAVKMLLTATVFFLLAVLGLRREDVREW
ncbi:hypothetical protein [Jeotgalibacillus aurantiacus]|uniref:hypothetical protein n=1 Tax=Jeotgalibacillus aurantiacus TaxID=2763266 RepID=UPI001D0A504B|nr:hypothetical protein [Jeotgalibacillus aurantiacus]